MKGKKSNILRILLVSIMLALLTQVVFASYGTGYPVPDVVQLEAGESARFYFTVDTHMHSENIECSYPLYGESPLTIAFDSESTFVEKKTSTRIYGTITAPEEIALGDYKQSFCVDCTDVLEEELTGALTKARNCGIPIQVQIVEQRTKKNEYVPALEQPSIVSLAAEQADVLGIILLVLILILYFWYLWRKHHKKSSVTQKLEEKNDASLTRSKPKKAKKKKKAKKA